MTNLERKEVAHWALLPADGQKPKDRAQVSLKIKEVLRARHTKQQGAQVRARYGLGTVRLNQAELDALSSETERVEDAKAEICVPTFMLKLMRGYDRQMRICELVRAQIQDIEIKFAFKGPARLQLFEHVLAPMADFPVREIVAASHILADLSLTPPTVVHDYLANRP